MNARGAFSFTNDQNVPAYDTQKNLIVFDEVCVLCNGFVQFVLRHDEEQKFLFTSAQNSLGQALYKHYDLPTENFETVIVVVDGVAYGKLDGFIAVMQALGGIWRIASILRILPKPIAIWIYDRIAKNRYAMFGKYDACPIPTDDMKARLI